MQPGDKNGKRHSVLSKTKQYFRFEFLINNFYRCFFYFYNFIRVPSIGLPFSIPVSSFNSYHRCIFFINGKDITMKMHVHIHARNIKKNREPVKEKNLFVSQNEGKSKKKKIKNDKIFLFCQIVHEKSVAKNWNRISRGLWQIAEFWFEFCALL